MTDAASGAMPAIENELHGKCFGEGVKVQDGSTNRPKILGWNVDETAIVFGY